MNNTRVFYINQIIYAVDDGCTYFGQPGDILRYYGDAGSGFPVDAPNEVVEAAVETWDGDVQDPNGPEIVEPHADDWDTDGGGYPFGYEEEA